MAAYSPFRNLYQTGMRRPPPFTFHLPNSDNPYSSNTYGNNDPAQGPATQATPFPTVQAPPAVYAPGSRNTPAAGAPTAQQQPAQQAPSFGTSIGGVNLAGDPILAQVQAYNDRVIAQAQASALAAKKSALIQFGSPELAQKTIGDANTAAAAKANPFSTLALLLGAHNTNTRGIVNTRNAQNLFYSSTRGNEQVQEGKNYLQNQSTAQGQVDAALRSYDQMVLDAQNEALDRWVSALSDAYMRYLQAQLANQSGGNDVTPLLPDPTPTDPTGGLPASFYQYALNGGLPGNARGRFYPV